MNQLRTLVAAGLVMIALAGCTGGGPDGQPTASPTAEAPTALDVAKCMRANGHPDFPDPAQDDEGNWAFPDSMPNYSVPQACTAVVRGQKAGEDERSGWTAEEMQQRRRYSACMREKGVPDFPDPDDEGNFPLSDQLRAAENSPAMRDARQACRQYEPPRGNKPSPTPGTGS
ncbi:hypothetical protein I0C86_24965 [Plantactinospora sp. S1510]|uniref:Lipoprotein n=1 Tax=Plantactinospora alkalitolerans TaxID=2789879 RepID=A0ABS0H153_9ACTN|nr:hypothetical protein [Plantactinospora alkalitolerans]MBF9132175.1 hypothetical protein [Plantactinospora alkalitolerans]